MNANKIAQYPNIRIAPIINANNAILRVLNVLGLLLISVRSVTRGIF